MEEKFPNLAEWVYALPRTRQCDSNRQLHRLKGEVLKGNKKYVIEIETELLR